MLHVVFVVATFVKVLFVLVMFVIVVVVFVGVASVAGDDSNPRLTTGPNPNGNPPIRVLGCRSLQRRFES